MNQASVRNWIWISLLVSLVLLTVCLLAATPLAKRVALGKAEDRGLVVEMGDFSLGWMRVEMSDVTVRLEGVKGVQADFERVDAELGWSSPRLRQIVVRGGLVQLDGTLEELKKRLEDWKSRRPKVGSSDTSSAPTRTDIVRELQIIWTNAWGDGVKQSISGLQIERSGDLQKVGADHILLARGDLTVEVAGALAAFPRSGLDLSQAQELGASEVRVIYNASEKSVPDAKDNDEPEGDEPEDDATTAPEEDESEDEARGLQDRLETNSARVARLNAALSLARERVVPRLPRQARIDRFWVTYSAGKERLHVGPNQLTANKTDASGYRVAIAPQGNVKGTPLAIEVTLSPKGKKDAATLSMKGGPVSLGTLGIEEDSFGLNGVDQTTLSGSLKVHLASDAKTLHGGGDVVVEGLALASQRLANGLVTFPRLTVSAEGGMHIDGSAYEISKASVALGETRFEGTFQLERASNSVTLQASAKAPLVSCQALLDSAPRGLLGPVELMRFDGTFSLDAGVEADTRALGKMKVRWDFDNGCRVRAVPPELDPEQFRGAFRREVIGAGNFPIQMEFGPLSSSWVPWDEVSPYVEKALLVTEDGRFFRHDGFDNRAIESAIQDNVKAGSFVRGASTISMQLAKNLYLYRSKTLSRKLQEAALTLLLEQSFEKRELLELYVNIVEFGPGIYGIRQAAEHYFNTHPGRLTAAQAFFLASVLPAPTREYFQTDGTLKETRLAYVHRLLGISARREALTEAELERALEEELVFGKADTTPRSDAEDDASETPDAAGTTPTTAPLNEPDPSPALHHAPIFPQRAPQSPSESPEP